MEIDELVRYYPRLYHMAEDHSWKSIRVRGLLSTARLIELFEVPDPLRTQLLTRQRPRSVTISHPMHGQAVIRDQAPLQVAKLRQLLTDITVEEWMLLLNSQVFFWPSPARVARLLAARMYRNRPHLVITVDTLSLATAHAAQIRLSSINSGATVYVRGRRGSATFQPIAEFRHPRPRNLSSPPGAIAELAVLGGVPDIARHTLEVQRRHGSTVLETIPVPEGPSPETP